MSKFHMISEKIIKINVGGSFYTSTYATLTKEYGSHIWKIFTGDLPCPRDERGSFFIDRDGPTFRYILNYLRSNRLALPTGYRELDLLRVEADFFGLERLVQEVDAIITSRKRRRRPRTRKKSSQSVGELHRVREKNGDLYLSDDESDWFYD